MSANRGVVAGAAVVLGLASAAAHLAAESAGEPTVALVAKPIPVLLLAAMVARATPSPMRAGVLAGLFASAAGDVLIQRPGGFLSGLAAFLVAHLCYIAGFWRTRREALWSRAIPVALFGVGMAWVLAGGLASSGSLLRSAVAVYMIAICTMIWRAAALVGAAGLPQSVGRLALGGAILFAASDSLIAVHRFVEPQPWADVPIMAGYWLGQIGIAFAAARAAGAVGR